MFHLIAHMYKPLGCDYDCGFLVDGGIGLILVIHTVCPSFLLVYYIVRMSTQPLLVYDLILFFL